MISGQKVPEGVTFHTLRHTYGSHLEMSGCSLKGIMELMGDKSIDAVKRYLHLSKDYKQEAVNKLDERMFGYGTPLAHKRKNALFQEIISSELTEDKEDGPVAQLVRASVS